MALVPKIDPNKIFASNAPSQDKPAAFDNYEKGMDETRKNLGRPTIPQLNYLHQTADQKILWIHQNGGGLPYDASIEYAENAVTLKDGELKQLVDGAWVETKTKSLPATAITTASTQNQQQINDFGGAKWYAKVGGYELGATVKLDNGDVVKSTAAANTVNPNLDMTGWVNPSNDARLVTPYDYGAIQKSTALVSEWYTVGSTNYRGYANLAAVKVDYPHVVDGTEFIAWAALQKFFDVVNSTNRAIFNMYGNFYINKELNFNGNGVTVYDKNTRVDCDCTIWDKSLNGLNYLIAFENAVNTKFTGVVRGYGTGSSTYATRKTIDIFLIKAGCGYSTFDVFIASYAKRWGLSTRNQSTQMIFNSVQARYCGTASPLESNTALHVTTTVTNIVNNGTPGSLQTSVLTLSSPLPDTMSTRDGHLYSKTADIAYEITAVSTDRLQVTVRPWVDPAHVGSDWYCCIGGAVSTDGNDGSVHKFGYIDSLVCNTGYWSKSLYPADVGTLTTQSNSFGHIIGASMSETTRGGSISNFYCENNAVNVLIPNTCGSTIDSMLGDPSKIHSYLYVGVGLYTRAKQASLRGLSILNISTDAVTGVKVVQAKGSGLYSSGTASMSPHFDESMPVVVKYRDSATIILNENEQVAALTGKTGGLFLALGSGANNQATGTWTFNPRSNSGWTVNSGASAAISGFTEPTIISVYADYINKNWIVKAINLNPIKSGSVIYDPPSLTSGSRTAIQTLTVTGAALNDKVAMAFSRDLQGVNLEGYVSAANIVSFYFENRTGATVDLASGTVSAKIV